MNKSNEPNKEVLMDNMPVITLTSGVRVANFSSPHAFTFDDGSVLPSCSKERTKAGSLRAVEKETKKNEWIDIELRFELNQEIAGLMIQAIKQAKDEEIDVVLVPFPVLNAWKEEYGDGTSIRFLLETANEVLGEYPHHTFWKDAPFRTIRTADRINKICCHDKFCK